MPKTLTALTNGASISAQTNIKKATGLAQEAANRISKGLSTDGKAAEKGIWTKLNAKVVGNEQVASNLGQGASVIQVAGGGMDQLNEIITRIATLAIQSNSDTVSATEREGADIEAQQQLLQFDNVLDTTDWLGVKLLKGSAGAATFTSAAAAVVEAAFGLDNTSAAAFAGTLNAASVGHIEGAVSAEPTVTAVGNGYNVTLKVGNQTFEAKGAVPVNSGTLTLVSGDSAIALDWAADVSSITDAATFKTQLKALVGWVDNQSTAKFVSGSLAMNAAVNGLSAATANMIAGTTVEPGKYALSYDQASKTVKLIAPDGEKYTETLTASGAQTVTFNNGFSFDLAAAFAIGTDIGQVMVNVDGGGSTQLSFQSDTYGGVTSVTMPSLDRATLGLDNITLKTKTGASAAQPLLEKAMDVVNQSSAKIIALQKRLELAEASATTAKENLMAARAAVGDTDLAKETTEFTKYNVLSQAGIAMKSQADQMFNNLLALVRG